MRTPSELLNLRPSAAHRWRPCAVAAIVGSIPADREDNVYAATGRGVMKWVETALDALEDESFFDEMLGKTESVENEETGEALEVTYRQGDVDAAKAAFAVVVGYEEQGARIFVEHPVKCLVGGRTIEGHADFIAIFPDRLIVIDLKNGAVPVYAFENDQVSLYLLGAIAEFGPRENYRIEIVQPQSIDQNATNTQWDFDESEVSKIESRFRWAVELGEAAAQSLVDSGEIPWVSYVDGEHCKYCAIKPTCPKRTNAAISAAALSGLPYDNETRLKFLLDNGGLIKDVVSGAEKCADEALETGKKVFGYKLIESHGNRSLRDNLTPGEIDILRTAGLVEKVDKMPTVAEVEKAGKKKLINAAHFIADGKKKPKRVPYNFEGTPWNATADYDAVELEKTEDFDDLEDL